MQDVKVNHADKWYMHKPESVLQRVTRNTLWDFEVQTDPSISASKSDVVLINTKGRTYQQKDCDTPADCWGILSERKENEMIDKYMDLVRILKKNYGMCSYQWY